MFIGIDLTEQEFDLRNQQISDAIRNEPDFNDELFNIYAIKNSPTAKGFWLQIVAGHEKYFSIEEIAVAVPYIYLENGTIEI